MTENITDDFAAWTSYIQEEYVENSGEEYVQHGVTNKDALMSRNHFLRSVFIYHCQCVSSFQFLFQRNV